MNIQEPLLVVEGLSKKINEDFSLRELSLSLYPGSVHVLVGENGSGKTKFLHLLCGIERPDSGSMRFCNRPYAPRDITDARKAGILFIGQDVQLFENLSVAENLFFDNYPRTLLGAIDIPRMIQQARRLLKELSIDLDVNVPVRKLGYAQRQLLAAARSCVKAWKLVAFDEPSAALAEPERAILFTIIKRLTQQGTSVLYVSHRIDEICRIGDYVSIIRQGRLIDTRSRGTVNESVLVHLLTGKIFTERYPRYKQGRGAPLLEVQNLSCGALLKNISFTVHVGEILGITGLMGSGRTLLAHCLVGDVPGSSGRLLLSGQEVHFSSPEEALQYGVALIPEDRNENAILHHQDLTLNMTIAALPQYQTVTGLHNATLYKNIKKYAERIGLRSIKPEDIPDTYSGGNQQKVTLARWIAKRARIYIMDEPTRGIDVSSKVDIYNVMADIAAKGGAIILFSSDLEEILGMCDRILILTEGRMIGPIPKEEASQEMILRLATSGT
ncbi:MAG: sugar ABC transporter ATP-binding protein [Breznakiellaceae bacterium]